MFALPSNYVSSALVTQTQLHKRSHITDSALIRFINVTQLHWWCECKRLKGAAALVGRFRSRKIAAELFHCTRSCGEPLHHMDKWSLLQWQHQLKPLDAICACSGWMIHVLWILMSWAIYSEVSVFQQLCFFKQIGSWTYLSNKNRGIVFPNTFLV